MKSTFLLLSLVTSIFFSACTNDTVGIFYSIENEVKTNDNDDTLPNTVTVESLALRDNKLWLSAHILYTRNTSDTAWVKVSLDEITGQSKSNSKGIIKDGTRLFLLAGNIETSNLQVYFSNTPEINSSWTKATFPSANEGKPANSSLNNMIPVYNSTGDLTHILVTAQTTSVANPNLKQSPIYRLTAGGTQFDALVLKNKNGSVIENSSIATSGAQTASRSYITTGSALYREEVTPGIFQEESGLITTGTPFPTWPSHIIAIPKVGNTLLTQINADFLLTSDQGLIYKIKDVDSQWEQLITTAFLYTGTQATPTFMKLWSEANLILVGTSKLGYLELVAGDTAPKLQTPAISTDASRYLSSSLSSANISYLLPISANELFIGTSSQGLWKLKDLVWAYE